MTSRLAAGAAVAAQPGRQITFDNTALTYTFTGFVGDRVARHGSSRRHEPGGEGREGDRRADLGRSYGISSGW